MNQRMRGIPFEISHPYGEHSKLFRKLRGTKIWDGGEKAQELKNQLCQTMGLLETIIIFVWAKFQRPSFGVEMDILLREWLQVENRARGVEGVLAGFFEGERVGECCTDFWSAEPGGLTRRGESWKKKNATRDEKPGKRKPEKEGAAC